MAITNRGKKLILSNAFISSGRYTNLYVMLFTSAVAPTVDINTAGELTEIANGNGYTTGGYQLSLNSTDFDTLTEDDTGDKALIKIKDVVWTASGGNLPVSGDGARYACMVDDNGTIANRQVIAYWDLSSDRAVSSGQTLTLQDLEINGTE